MISYNLQKCVTIIVLYISRLVFTVNKLVDFDVYFDDGKIHGIGLEQIIEKKDSL
jgi:hypothetical protein